MSGRGGRGGRGGGRGGRGGAPMSQSKLLLQRSAQEAGLDNDRQMISLQEIIRPSLYPDFTWHSSGQLGHLHDAPAAASNANANKKVKLEDDDADGGDSNAAGAGGGVKINMVKRPASVVALIQKQRQLLETFLKSCHHIRQNQDVDIVRYGKPNISTAPDQAVLLSFTAGTAPLTTTAAGAADGDKEDGAPTDETAATAASTAVATRIGTVNNNNKLATDERYFPAELLSTHKQLQSARRARNPDKKTLTDLLNEAKDNLDDDDDDDDKEKENDDDEEEELPEEELEAEDAEDYTMNYYDSENDSDGGGDDGGEATF